MPNERLWQLIFIKVKIYCNDLYFSSGKLINHQKGFKSDNKETS